MIGRIRSIVLQLGVTFVILGVSSSLAEARKKVVTMDDYGLWRTVTSTAMSDDGSWVTFDYNKPDAEPDAPDERNLQIKHLDSNKVYEIPFAINPKFSGDSKWIAYVVDVDRSERKKRSKEKKPVQRNVQLLNLESGDKVTWKNADSFSFSENGWVLVIHKPKAEGVKHAGRDVVIRDLRNNLDHHFGSVSEYSFNKPGTHLAFLRDAADQTGNGLYSIDLNTGVRIPLSQNAATYSELTWDEDGTAVAALFGNAKKGAKQRPNKLVAFTGLTTGPATMHEFAPKSDSDFPEGTIISERSGLQWNTDATKVFFGIAPVKPKAEKDSEDEESEIGEDEEEAKEEKPSDLDVWHWNDKRIQSVQRARANREKNRTYQSVYHLDSKKFVRLADELMKTVSITRDGKWGVGGDDEPYIHDWKPRKSDFYRVDTATGERLPIETALQYSMGLSPDSRHWAYWKDGDVWVYKLDEATSHNLTKSAPIRFVNTEYDNPGEVPSYGITGWTKDGKHVILNHRYDLWLQPLDGAAATNLTGQVGSVNEIRLRYLRLDLEEKFVDLANPIYLSAYGEWTKKAGFYALDARESNAVPKQLYFDDKRIDRRPRKAKHADQFMFTMQSFTESPDLYVSDASFEKPRRLTHANPQQKKYSWGHTVLIDYTNKDGVRLQGSLAIPDSRKRNERLPMVVAFYEKTSQRRNLYIKPRLAYGAGSELMEMVSKGYLLLSPDVHFNTGATGDDMLDCIEAAVDKCVELGYADPERIGLQGHSFSGYGASYIAARSKKFAAVSSGAGVVNHLSDFNHLWGYSIESKKGSGNNAHQYDIYGQGRMGTNPYDDYELYRSQSPVMHVKDMTTPLLLLQGEMDTTVAWIEAVEMYNAMRFNDKNVILLSYPKEGHSIEKRENRIDYTKRVLEYFDHYLMDKPAPDWITRGVPFLEKKTSLAK
jgi:dipeptidyl aminopeptidase/acylaminoacyl peptidase